MPEIKKLYKSGNVSEREIAELNTITKKAQPRPENGIRLIEWFPLEITSINGMSCQHYCWKQQKAGSAPEMVDEYYFQNYDRSHPLTFTCPVSEISNWKDNFTAIWNSFRITAVE